MSIWEVIVYFLLATLFIWFAIVPIVAIVSGTKRPKFWKENKEFKRSLDNSNKIREEMKEGHENIKEELAQLNKRLASIEKLLKEVE